MKILKLVLMIVFLLVLCSVALIILAFWMVTILDCVSNGAELSAIHSIIVDSFLLVLSYQAFIKLTDKICEVAVEET